MKELYLSSMTKDSEFEDEMFLDIFNEPDIVERAKYIEAVRKKAKEFGRYKEFENLLKAWMQKNIQKEAKASVNWKPDLALQVSAGYGGSKLGCNKMRRCLSR